jgi:hypothetical protein
MPDQLDPSALEWSDPPPTRVGERHKLTQPVLAFVDWLAEAGPFEHPTGGALAVMRKAAQEAGTDLAGGSIAGTMRRLEQRGLIEREIRGKRTFRIAAVAAPPVAPPAEPAPPKVQTQPPPAQEPAQEQPAPQEQEQQLPAPREPLAGTVHLALDLDPTLARLVLDLVEAGRGVRPVDRDEVQLLIAQAQNKATARSAEGMARHAERLSALEQAVDNLGAGMRGLGVALPTSNGSGHKKVRADYRALGVKDSRQRKLLDALATDGWTLTKKPNGHIAASKDGHATVELSATPSDNRTPLNDRARARQAGAAV